MTRPITEADMSKRAAEMEPWYWWGLPTFYKCPWNGDPAACDIGLVGVPHSSGNGSTERDQHLAPRAVRHMSGWYRRAHQKFGFRPWDEFRIHDLGDVPLPEPWSTTSQWTISRSSIPASMRRGRGRSRSAGIIRSPVRSCALWRSGIQALEGAEARAGAFRRPSRRCPNTCPIG